MHYLNGIYKNGNKLNTGFLGTPVLCATLSEFGAVDLAYQLLLNEDYPGWLFAVNLGATSVWERWNSVGADGRISDTGMNSLNHYAYGSIAAWMYRYMCGFRPRMGEDICMQMKPMPSEELEWVKGELETIYGKFVSAWKRQENGYQYSLTVPFNASVEVHVGRKVQQCKKGTYKWLIVSP